MNNPDGAGLLPAPSVHYASSLDTPEGDVPLLDSELRKHCVTVWVNKQIDSGNWRGAVYRRKCQGKSISQLVREGLIISEAEALRLRNHQALQDMNQRAMKAAGMD